MTPPSDLLSRPCATLFKHDRRSRVWSVACDGQIWVIKRFEHAAWRQRAGRWLGLHPAQRERRWVQRLQRAALPVVPIAATGVDEQGRSWLAGPFVGPSFYQWVLESTPPDDARQRHELCRSAGRLAGQLLARRWTHVDFKASNLLVDASGGLQLIDPGAMRHHRWRLPRRRAGRTVQTLLDNLNHAAQFNPCPARMAVSKSDRLRFRQALVSVWPAGETFFPIKTSAPPKSNDARQLAHEHSKPSAQEVG